MIVTATREHVDAVKGHVRDIDRQEMWDVAHLDPDDAVDVSFSASDLCWAVVTPEGVAALFGVDRPEKTHHMGMPWLVGTDLFDTVGLPESREARKYVDVMLEHFDLLFNWVDTRNATAIRWIKWLGFTLCEPKPYGFERKPFHCFWMRRQ